MMDNYDKMESIFMPYIWEKTQLAMSQRQKFVHYTSAETAVNIIRHRKVWMRRTSMMNDYSEVEHGLNCLIQAYNDPELGKVFSEALDSVYSGLSSEVEDLFNQWTSSLVRRSYMICLSEHLDNEDEIGRLSMWRAYGGKNSVALVLNPEAIMNENNVLGAFSVPVVYTDDVNFKKTFSNITLRLENNLNLLKRIPREELKRQISIFFAFHALATKHPGFREEREWKVVAIPDVMGDGMLEKSIEIIDGVPQQIYKIPLQNSIDEGLSGMELNELIDKIIIGPAAFGYSIMDALILELEEAGVENASDKIIVSNIPLR